MAFLDIIRYIEGYVTIQADGVFTERFINICTRRNLEIWDVRRLGGERITAKVSVTAFKNLRPVCRRTKTRARIVSRHGLPFFMNRLKNRKIAVTGVLAVLIALWYMTGHIMGITVFGNNRIPTETILEHLARSGIALGKTTDGIDSDKVRNRMMTDLNDLAWIGINVSGSRIYIEVVERIEKEQGVDMEKPCNLVAAKDGVIQSIEARNGQSMVKVNSGVCEGDVLVSGIMDSPVTGFRYVHAYGEVYARTAYTKTREYPLEYREKLDTGETKTRYTFKILDKSLPLFIINRPPYETYAVDESEKEYRLPVDVIPSLFVKKETYREQYEENKKRTAKEALEIGRAELEKELMEEIGEKEVIDTEVSNTLTERGTLEVTVTIACLENIAREVAIEQMEITENTP